MPGPFELLLAGVALLVVLGVGTVAHELTHAITLRVLGVGYEIDWLPRGEGSGLAHTTGALATVTPRGVSPDLDLWRLRVAAVMPLVLVAPLGLILAGVLPDPFAMGDPVLAAATIGWLACGLPSPTDFSLVWHAEAAIERYAA